MSRAWQAPAACLPDGVSAAGQARARGAGEGGERMVEEELRQLGRDLLDAPIPRHLREILTTARDRQG